MTLTNTEKTMIENVLDSWTLWHEVKPQIADLMRSIDEEFNTYRDYSFKVTINTFNEKLLSVEAVDHAYPHVERDGQYLSIVFSKYSCMELEDWFDGTRLSDWFDGVDDDATFGELLEAVGEDEVKKAACSFMDDIDYSVDSGRIAMDELGEIVCNLCGYADIVEDED